MRPRATTYRRRASILLGDLTPIKSHSLHVDTCALLPLSRCPRSALNFSPFQIPDTVSVETLPIGRENNTSLQHPATAPSAVTINWVNGCWQNPLGASTGFFLFGAVPARLSNISFSNNITLNNFSWLYRVYIFYCKFFISIYF